MQTYLLTRRIILRAIVWTTSREFRRVPACVCLAKAPYLLKENRVLPSRGLKSQEGQNEPNVQSKDSKKARLQPGEGPAAMLLQKGLDSRGKLCTSQDCLPCSSAYSAALKFASDEQAVDRYGCCNSVGRQKDTHRRPKLYRTGQVGQVAPAFLIINHRASFGRSCIHVGQVLLRAAGNSAKTKAC